MYYTLVASLPVLPPHFDVERTPITAPRLGERLRQLTQEDSDMLRQLADFFSWDRQLIERTDEQIADDYQRLLQVRHPLILKIVRHRINVRTIVSALRRRNQGADGPVALGPLAKSIKRSWNDPTFRLHPRFPWIEQFEQRMLAGDAMQAERLLFEFTWSLWCRMAAEFTFSFEAILLYVARWEIIHRWASRNAEAGQIRFDKMIEETLGEYASAKF